MSTSRGAGEGHRRRRPPRRGTRPQPAATRDAADSWIGRDLDLLVGAPGHGGFCVARHEGRVVFVRHALPGERVVARVTEGGASSRFLRADAIAVIEPSADRVEPVCRHAGPPRVDGGGGCGGCDWQHATPAAQRRLAAHVVQEQFRRLAKLDLDVTVEPVPGDTEGFGWRTRVEFAITPDGRAGLRPPRSHGVIPLQECPIAHPAVIESLVLQADWRDCAAVDVVAPNVGPPVVHPVPRPRRPATPEPEVPTVTERVRWEDGEAEYAVSARGFWQVHPGAASTFVQRVLDILDPGPGDHVVDLYAGVGLFSVPLARSVGPAGSVLAVEGDLVACEHARVNTAAYPQVSVTCGRVEDVVDGLTGPIDAVVLDPPRSGAGRDVVARLAALHPRVIAYVACDPAALARDTASAMEHGYRLADLAAYAAFPMTHHVECIATFVPNADVTDFTGAQA